MRRPSFVLVALVSCLASPAVAHGQGWIVPRPCSLPPRALDDRAIAVPVRDCAARIERTRSDVRVRLEGRILHYEVDERFVNRGAAVGEADYLFPLPNGAAFEDLKLSINGELVAGETMDADRARGIYESIVRARRDPALVEWVGHGLLRARVFPLEPGAEKRVVVRFQSVAPREGGALRLDYLRGGTTGVGGVAPGASNGPKSFTLLYSPSPELGTPYSPTHELSFADSDGARRVAVRGDARDVTMLIPIRAAAAASIAVLPYAPGNDDGFALITVSPPAVRRDAATPRDITLVLDVSGSMSGRKIEQARAAGRQLLATLRPSDRFRLIDFSSDVRTFRDAFADATPDNIREADRYLAALDANGGTNIEGALREALRPVPARGRLPLVLFVTDGEPTIGDGNPDHLAALAADANAHAAVTRRIFTFGLGADVNVSLLEQLALDGRGTSQFVRPDESVERMVGVVADRLVDPVLTDVRVSVDGNVRLTRMLPAQTTDIFADRDLILLARYSGHGPARVTVEGTQRGTPVRWTSTVDLPAQSRENPFVARLWATQRVGFLSAERRKNGANREIDDEIRSLGERYGIPTELTSYLVTEPRLATAMPAIPATAAGGVVPTTASAIAPAPSAPSARRLDAATSARSRQFEAAKSASAQRVALNAAVIDSMASARDASAGVGAATTRRIDGRTFVLRDSTWTDIRYHAGMKSIDIEPFSPAYFDLLGRLPELRAVFALGPRVVVVGRDRAITLASAGASRLDAAALNALVAAW